MSSSRYGAERINSAVAWFRVVGGGGVLMRTAVVMSLFKAVFSFAGREGGVLQGCMPI